ncbi:MAG: hypothetical protein QOJ39_3661 [Candidatus Eremiobacteraeota bacterium]|nr:hypothetical protein [Candidatus Eremiobacteraeota bacterium]
MPGTEPRNMAGVNSAPGNLRLLVLIGLVAFATGVPVVSTGAAPQTSSPAADKKTNAGGATPSARPTPKPTATPAPEGRTRLSQRDEFTYEMAHDQNDLARAYAAGGARIGAALLWPVVCVVGLVLAAGFGRKWLAQRVPADAARPVVAAARVEANTQFSVPATDLDRANAAAQTLSAQFQKIASLGAPQFSAMAMLSAPVPKNAPPALSDARAEVERYAERVFRAMLASQYGLLALASTRNLRDRDRREIRTDPVTFAGVMFVPVLEDGKRVGMIRVDRTGAARFDANAEVVSSALADLASGVLGHPARAVG